MSIPNVGALRLLTEQYSYLAGLKVCLISSNTAESTSRVWSDLTEASFSGYSRVTLGSLNTAAIVGGRASTTPVSNPVFTNGSGAPVTIYGVALLDDSDDTLIDFTNIGTTTIPAGGTFSPPPTLTDKQE